MEEKANFGRFSILIMSSHESVEEQDLDDVVKAITDRGWQNAASLFLEVGQPLTLIGSQLLWIFQPMLSLFVSADSVGRYARLMEQPDVVSGLIEKLNSDENTIQVES